LTHLGETRDDLVGNIRAEVYAQSHSNIGQPNHITKFLAASEFTLLQPLLEQVLLSLLQHRTRKFNGFEVVELPFLQEDTEVAQDRRLTTGNDGGLFELFDYLGSSQNSLK
jgi:hypothetical protein